MYSHAKKMGGLLLLLGLFLACNAQSNFTNPHYLPMDTAQLRIRLDTALNDLPFSNITLSGTTANCWKCSKHALLYLPDDFDSNSMTTSLYTNISTQWEWHYTISYFVTATTMVESYSTTFKLGEHGSYTLVISTNMSFIQTTTLVEDTKPIPTYLPLIIGFIVIGCLAILIPLLSRAYNKLVHRETPINYYEGDLRDDSKIKSRVASLDVFRGMSLTIMIFVNYGGGGYWFFDHSYWNGLTIADLVFPWFIFIMGVAMPISFSALLRKGMSRMQLLMKLIRRSIILFALGMFINNGADILNWRIPGVLQRFGVSYLFTGIIIIFIPTVGDHQGTEQGKNLEPIDFRASETEQLLANRAPKYKHSFFPFLLQWAAALVFLTIWFLVTFTLHVPGCPTGYIGPGGYSEDSKYFYCTGGAARYIDEHVFGLKHMYLYPTCKDVYNTGPYDPEGLLGCFTSIFLCFLGTQAGRIIQVHQAPMARVMRWCGWGVAFGSLGTLLAKASQNDGWIPINKNLWSPSFIFVMAGLGFLALALFYMLVDVWRVWSGAPFLWVGMNSILIYCGHETLGYLFPFNFWTGRTSSSHGLFLASNMIGVGMWILIAFKMYSNDFFVNI